MARLYPVFDMAEAMGTHELDLDVATVGELVSEMERRYGETWRNFAGKVTILVGGVSINALQGMATPLDADDDVWLVLPAAGG